MARQFISLQELFCSLSLGQLTAHYRNRVLATLLYTEYYLNGCWKLFLVEHIFRIGKNKQTKLKYTSRFILCTYLSMVSTATSVGGATKPSRNETYFSINLTVLFLTRWRSPSWPMWRVSFSMSPSWSWERSRIPWGGTPSNQQPISFVLTASERAL